MTNESDGNDEASSYGAGSLPEPDLLPHLEDCLDIHTSLDAVVRRRRELGISKADMARLLGISVYRISQFESEDSDPTVSMMQQYARVLGMKVSVTAMRPSGPPHPSPWAV